MFFNGSFSSIFGFGTYLIWVMNWGLVTVARDASRKKGPGWSPLTLMYWRIAATGQIRVPVRPMTMFNPEPNWSHFDFLRWNWIMRGLLWLSTVTSPQACGRVERCNWIWQKFPQTEKNKKCRGGNSPQDCFIRIRGGVQGWFDSIAHRTVLSGLEEASRDDLIQ